MNKQTESFLLAEADIAAAAQAGRGAVVGVSRPHESAHLHVAAPPPIPTTFPNWRARCMPRSA